MNIEFRFCLIRDQIPGKKVKDILFGRHWKEDNRHNIIIILPVEWDRYWSYRVLDTIEHELLHAIIEDLEGWEVSKIYDNLSKFLGYHFYLTIYLTNELEEISKFGGETRNFDYKIMPYTYTINTLNTTAASTIT